MAWFLGKRLMSGGHQSTGVFGRNPEAVRELADALLSAVCGKVTDVRDGEADICLMAVSDIAIGKVAMQLSLRQTVLVHTAGSVLIDQITTAAKDCAVLWPVYSIQKSNLPAHRNIPCAWEANTPKASRFVQSIGHGLTDVLFEAQGEQRKWLHVDAVFGNNFINHLMVVCEKICLENDLPFSLISPVIEQTFERAKSHSPQTLQTGPAVRRDTTTIQDHLAMLSEHRKWQQIYESVTESIQANRSPK